MMLSIVILLLLLIVGFLVVLIIDSVNRLNILTNNMRTKHVMDDYYSHCHGKNDKHKEF